MKKEISLLELAKITNSKLVGDPSKVISSVNPLDVADERDASFLSNPKYLDAMKNSSAGVICIDPATKLIDQKNFLVSDNPSRTFQQIAELIFDDESLKTGFSGIHASAVIHESAVIAKDVIIGPSVVIDQGVTIESGTIIHALCSIGPKVVIGKDCVIHSNVSIREASLIGNRVTLQPGCVIGSCGFGFTTSAEGNHTKLMQIGNVIIEDDVEIGANTTIDRARFKSTLIRKGTKIDNLVQIGHNVEVGKNNIIVSQAGIAGSAKFGDNVFLGGQSGVIGHVEVADNVKIATRGGISKSISEPGIYGGGPAQKLSDFNKQQVHMRKIEKYAKKIEELEKRLSSLEIIQN